MRHTGVQVGVRVDLALLVRDGLVELRGLSGGRVSRHCCCVVSRREWLDLKLIVVTFVFERRRGLQSEDAPRVVAFLKSIYDTPSIPPEHDGASSPDSYLIIRHKKLGTDSREEPILWLRENV